MPGRQAMSTAERHARALRRRYRIHHPGDLDRVLADKDIPVVRFPFRGRTQEAVVENVIGIAETITDPRAVQELVAHALGHVLMHAGNQLAMLDGGESAAPWQWEQQAWTFAYELLMPAQCIERLLKRGCPEDELQEYFEVSEEFYARRMEAFAAQHAEAIARAREAEKRD